MFVLIVALLLSACATIPDPSERRALADGLAAGTGWQANRLEAAPFTLMAYTPSHIAPAKRLTVYIEGDGFAWVTGSLPSPDPTPRDPLALRLALVHRNGNAAYLARPCQYVDAERNGCSQRYWTEERFAPEVITSAGLAIDKLKARFGATRLVLVGYSGGGGVAALLAARRDDVERLVTVAGNLDHSAWTGFHRVRPLLGSLNAADFSDKLASLPQVHFLGGRDRVIPPDLARQWPRGISGGGGRNLEVIPDFDHACCWGKEWLRLLDRAGIAASN